MRHRGSSREYTDRKLTLEVAIEVFVAAERKQLDDLFRLETFVGKKDELPVHPELMDSNSRQVTYLVFTDGWGCGYGTDGTVQFTLLLFVQPLYRPPERWGLKNPHQSKTYSSLVFSSRAIRMSLITENGKSGFSSAILPMRDQYSICLGSER